MALSPPHRKGEWTNVTTFYLSSEMEQSVWMICLFFSLILDVFLFLASPDRGGSRRCRLLNAGVFIALLILLCIAGDAFDKKADGLPIKSFAAISNVVAVVHRWHGGYFAPWSNRCVDPSERPDT